MSTDLGSLGGLPPRTEVQAEGGGTRAEEDAQ